MQQKVFKDEYPIFTITYDKSELTCKSVDAIIEALKAKIDAHPVATYIAIFDHYSHTSSLKVGEIDEKMQDAKNLICCFGKELKNPDVLAVRPRSIGVAQIEDTFHISFMKAPNPNANASMIEWVKSLKV